MDPFSILGVSPQATDDEIRSAYRKLVKLHHPDKNPNGDREQIRAINWAYEVLTDHVKRSRYYQQPSVAQDEFYQEEDPVEAYKREFKRKRWEREKREKEEQIAYQLSVMQVMRFVNIPIFVFAVLLTLDRMLPVVVYHEILLESSKESRAGKRGSVEYSFVRTQNFKMYFATDMYVYRDSFTMDTLMVNIYVSPIFKIPVSASFFHDNATYSGNVVKTFHSRSFLVTNILLFCVVCFLQRKPSSTAYAFCFFPGILFALFMWINLID